MNSEMLIKLNEEAAQRAQLSLLRRAFGLFQAVTASPFNSTNTTLIVDVSKWVPVADVALLKANGVRGIICRIGEGLLPNEDPTFAYYVQECYNNDMLCIGYYVIHPEYGETTKICVDAHLKYLLKWIENKEIKGVFIDCEIITDPGTGKPIAPKWVNDRTRSLIDETQRARPDLVVGLYTAGWVTQQILDEKGYRIMDAWMYKYPLWWAYYVYIAERISIEWADLSKYYPTSTPKNLPPDATGNGAAKLHLLQWTGDRLMLDGMYSRADKSLRAAADFNFFMGSEQACYEFFNFVPRNVTPPPEPPDDQQPPEPPASDGSVLAELQAIHAELQAMRAEAKQPRTVIYSGPDSANG